jgi:hypothetical protein
MVDAALAGLPGLGANAAEEVRRDLWLSAEFRLTQLQELAAPR